jgi:hypothetical protein
VVVVYKISSAGGDCCSNMPARQYARCLQQSESCFRFHIENNSPLKFYNLNVDGTMSLFQVVIFNLLVPICLRIFVVVNIFSLQVINKKRNCLHRHTSYSTAVMRQMPPPQTRTSEMHKFTSTYKQRTICQICKILSSATDATIQSSCMFHPKSDTFCVCPPWMNKSSGGPSSASSGDCSSPI